MIPIVMPVTLLILTFVVLALLSFFALVGVDHLLDVWRKRTLLRTEPAFPIMANHRGTMIDRVSPVPACRRVEGYALPEHLYYHQGHAWMAPQESGKALIGIDEFAAKLIGMPIFLVTPRKGQTVRQGERVCTVRRKGRNLDILSPVDGEVVQVNGTALENPDLFLRDPYGEGWLAAVKTRDVRRNLRNLLSGDAARRWMEGAALELRSLFSGKLGLVFQDGGLPMADLADCLNPDDWHRFARRVLMMEQDKSD